MLFHRHKWTEFYVEEDDHKNNYRVCLRCGQAETWRQIGWWDMGGRYAWCPLGSLRELFKVLSVVLETPEQGVWVKQNIPTYEIKIKEE